MSDPELLNSIDLDVTFVVSFAALVLLVLTAWFVVVGYSMKFALAVSGAGRFGFWKSMLMVFVAALFSTAVSLSLTLSFPGNLLVSFLSIIGSVGVYCLVISAMGQCSLGKGFVTYLLNGFFNLLGAVPVVILMFVGVSVVRWVVDPDGAKMEKWNSGIAQIQANREGNAFAVTNVSGTENGFGTAWNGSNDTEVANPTQDQNQAAEAASLPRRMPQPLPAGQNAKPKQAAPAAVHNGAYSNPFAN